MDSIEEAMPPKLKLEQIERYFLETKEKIQNIDHLHMDEINDWIDSPLTLQLWMNLFL